MFAGSRLLLPVSNFMVPKLGRKEGHAVREPLLLRGIAGAEEIGQQEEAEIASGCPRRWCWSNGRAGGTEGSLPCSWDEEGWLPSERERRSRRRSPVGRSLLPSARLGEEQGTGDSRPVNGAGVVHYHLLHRPRSVPTAYREEVSTLTIWCQENHLSLNIDKTKELVVDYRRQSREHTPITIDKTSV